MNAEAMAACPRAAQTLSARFASILVQRWDIFTHALDGKRVTHPALLVPRQG